MVVDEYGEVEGLVTLEDILEEIVGDISDEQDVVVAGVRAQPDGSVVVDGSVPIRDLNRAMDWRLPDEEATTVAGLVIHEARSIPERGQSFTFHGFRFRVLRRERNRITALRIVPVPRETRGRRRREAEAGRDGVLNLASRQVSVLGQPSPGACAWIASACTEPASSLANVAFIMRWRSTRLFPLKACRHDINAEMRLAARPVAGMALMQM